MTKDKFYRANERIRFSPVNVVDEDGQNLGTMPTFRAIGLAKEKGLDLVEVSPNTRPPVCRIMDFGRFKYEQAKKDKANKAKQKEVELKEIRLTAKIGDHDIEYKAKQAREFFDQGDKIKVSMRLRGRENVFVDQALAVFRKFSDQAGLEYEKPPFKMGSVINGMLVKIKEKKIKDNLETGRQNEVKNAQSDSQKS